MYTSVVTKHQREREKGLLTSNEKLPCFIMMGFFKMLLVSPQTKRSLKRFYLVLKLLWSSRLNKKQNQNPNFQTFHKIPGSIVIQHPLRTLHSITIFSKVNLSTFFKLDSKKESVCQCFLAWRSLLIYCTRYYLTDLWKRIPRGLFHASVSTYCYQISFVTTLQIKRKIQSQKKSLQLLNTMLVSSTILSANY